MRPSLLRRRALIAAAPTVIAGFSRRSVGQPLNQDAVSSLKPVTGPVRIDALRMGLTPPEGLGFLDAKQTRFLFTTIYPNPESDSDGVFGCVLPVPPTPGAPGSFEVLIRAVSGRIADTGPGSSLDPMVIKRGFRAWIAAVNATRADGETHFKEADIVIPAHYDRARHALTVGKSFQWSDEPEPSVNLDVFLLTRRGAVILTATAPLPSLKKLEDAAQAVAENIRLDPSEDYEAGKTEVAGPLTLNMLAVTLGRN